MAETSEETKPGSKKMLYWGIGIAVGTLLLVLIFLSMRKPAPKTYNKDGGGKPAPDSPGANIIDTATHAIQKVVAANKTKLLKEGSTGAEVSALQDDLGSIGTYAGFPGITVNGIWDAETTKALGAQYQQWNEAPQWSITLADFEIMMNKHAPQTAQSLVDNPTGAPAEVPAK